MNSDSVPLAKTANSRWRAIVPIVFAIVVVLVGPRIPLPGVDVATLGERSAVSLDGAAMARVSIFALGVLPLFTVLAYAEIARLLFPRSALRLANAPENAAWAGGLLKCLVLLLTAVQGHAVLSALTAIGFLDGSARTSVAGIASYVGASAVLLWLADAVRLPNVRSGLWLLLAIPAIESVPGGLGDAIDLARFGVIGGPELSAAGVTIAVAVAMVVVADRMLAGGGGRSRAIPSEVLLWPPFLANLVAGHLIAIAPMPNADPVWVAAAFSALSAVLIPIFVAAYGRLIRTIRPEIAARRETGTILAVIAGVQVVVVLGTTVVGEIVPMTPIPDGGRLIVVVTVLLATLGLWRGAPVAGRTAE